MNNVLRGCPVRVGGCQCQADIGGLMTIAKEREKRPCHCKGCSGCAASRVPCGSQSDLFECWRILMTTERVAWPKGPGRTVSSAAQSPKLEQKPCGAHGGGWHPGAMRYGTPNAQTVRLIA